MDKTIVTGQSSSVLKNKVLDYLDHPCYHPFGTF